jgi:hypothetical protein
MRRTTDRPRYRPGQALTTEEKLLAVTLRAQGLTHQQIGDSLGRARETICKGLREATDAQLLLADNARAKALLEAAELIFAESWVEAAIKGAERGRHEPARDALAALGVVALRQQVGASGIQVLVGVPMFGLPGFGAEGVEASVVALDVPATAFDEGQKIG